jgi:hypothetical protein
LDGDAGVNGQVIRTGRVHDNTRFQCLLYPMCSDC